MSSKPLALYVERIASLLTDQDDGHDQFDFIDHE